jgi:hypothetical protein
VRVPVRAVYRERLVVPLSWVLLALVVAGLAAAELHGGTKGWRAVAPYVVLLPLAVVGLLLMSRREIRVEDGMLHVPGARAPLSTFGAPEVLERDALRLWLGPNADAAAWVAVRPWLRTAVRLPVDDPEDDTPYWVVGTRRPVALVAALS